jgi:hypothetical protein
MKSANKEAHSLGFGYNSAPDTPIQLPKANVIPGYGKKKPFVKAHGGDQYGVTLHNSAPAVDFPKSPAAFAGKSMIGTQKSEG